MINELARLEYLKRDFSQCLEAVMAEIHVFLVTESDTEQEAQSLINDCQGVSKTMDALLAVLKESSMNKTEFMSTYATPEEIKEILASQKD